MTGIEYTQLIQMISDLPILVKRGGKDAEQVKAFLEDAKDAFDNAKLDEERVALFAGITLVVIKGYAGLKRFNLFNWDPLKAFRLAADDLARTLNFVRYKALRNLKSV